MKASNLRLLDSYGMNLCLIMIKKLAVTEKKKEELQEETHIERNQAQILLKIGSE